MFSRLVLSLLIVFTCVSPMFGQTSIEAMGAGQLVNSKEQIPECRGLYFGSPPSKEMACVQFFLRRGQQAEESRDFTSAVLLFSEAIRTNHKKSYTEPYWRRASSLEKQAKFDAAMIDYNEAISREPTDSISLARRGMLHLMIKNATSAFEDLNRAIALDPGQADALMTRGDAYLRLNEDEGACGL